jgi:hypothetical protein
MAYSHCVARNLEPDRRMRDLVGRLPLRVVRSIAGPFNCPVWIFHQISTEGAQRAPGQAPKLTDAKDAKDFPENVAFAFMVGMKNDKNMVVLANRKQRREGVKRDSILLVDGEFGRLVDVSNEYFSTGRSIVSVRETSQFAPKVETTLKSLASDGFDG